MMRRAAAITSIALLLPLSGCTDQPDNSPDKPLPGGLTAPGTVLALGETARVHTTGGTATLELAVTSIDESQTSELPLQLDNGDAYTPYYVHVDMKLLDGDPYGGTMDTYLTAYAGDEWAGHLTIAKPFPDCQEKNWPRDTPAGTSISTCLTFMAPRDAGPVDRVAFSNEDEYLEIPDYISWQRQS